MKAKTAILAAGIVAFVSLFPLITLGKDAIELNVQVDSQPPVMRGYSNVRNAIDALSTTNGLHSLFPGYTASLSVAGTANVGDVVITETSPAGSPALRFQVPSCGVDQPFASGSTRDLNNDQLRRYLEHNTNNVLGCIATQQSTGLFGGGPGSVGSQISSSDLDSALMDSGSGAGLDARFGSFAAGGYQSNDLLLPLNSAWRLSARDTIEVDVPISTTDTEGSRSYSGGVGLLWRRRMTTNWSLQPSVHIGAAGSVDLATASAFWSVGLSSVATFELPDRWRMTLANGLTYLSSIPLSFGRINLNYDISNLIFRNGVLVSRDFGIRIFDLPTRGSLFTFDTRFAGTKVSVKDYQEIGFFVSAGSLAPVSLGATYFVGDKGLRGFTVNTGVRF